MEKYSGIRSFIQWKRMILSLGICLSLWLVASVSSVYAAESYIQGENTGLTQDDEYMRVPIGFDFTYYGNTYDELNVSTNGFVTFNNAKLITYGGHFPIPGIVGHKNYIAPFNADLVTEGGSHADGKPTVYYKTVGSAPNRTFIVQWTNMYFYNTTIQMGTFQLYLYEGTNEIQFQYRSLLGGDDSFGNSATIGIENEDGSDGIQYSYDIKSIEEGQAIRFNPSGAGYTMNTHAHYEEAYLIDPNAPAVPQLNAPANGEQTPVTTALVWTDTDKNGTNKAESFKVYVSEEPSFATKLVNETVTDATYYPLNGLTLDHTYYWRIEAINGNGSSLSDTYSFTVKNKLPVVTDSVKHGLKGTPLPFTVEDFTSYYQDGDNDSLAGIQVASLPKPSKGKLELNGSPVSVNEVVYADHLNELTFVPAEGFAGATDFSWKGYDGIDLSASAATTQLIITSGNADLTDLTVSYGTLTPAFSRLMNTYQLQVPYGTSSITVTGVVYDADATFVVLGNEALSGVPTTNIALDVGVNTIPILVTAQDGVTTNMYNIIVERLTQKRHSSPSSPSSTSTVVTDPGTEATPASNTSGTKDNEVEVSVDGVAQEKSAAAVTEQVAGRTVTTVRVDNDKLLTAIESGKMNELKIPYSGSSEVVIGELNGQLVKAMEGKESSIVLQTEKGSYLLPASQIGIDQIAKQLNAQAELKDVKISIQISNTNETQVHVLQTAAQQNGFTVLSQPINFEISASYNGKSIGINQFGSYVERLIPISDGVTAAQVKTGVVLSEDGTVTPVPTKLIQRDGKYYASLKSLTNSTYAVVGSSKAFTDLEQHWAQKDVNDLASRLIISGSTDHEFKPEASITRAEFTAIAVRALGLKPDKQADAASGLTDVNDSDWYAGVVQTATRYGIIQGFEDGTFRPNQQMTRQEAFVILARVMKLAGLQVSLTEQQAQESIAPYTDGGSLSDWGRAAAATAISQGIVQGDQGMLLPGSKLTRAQSAVMLKRIVQQAQLID